MDEVSVGSGRRPQPLSVRLLRLSTVAPNGCWIWTGKRRGNYGGLTLPNGHRTEYAHRAAYTTFIGPIPNGMDLDHVCHSRDLACPGGASCPHRLCINPWHLEPVTRAENLRRGRTGRKSRGRPAPRDCDDHRLEPVTSKSGGTRRKCRACEQRYQQRALARRKAAR